MHSRQRQGLPYDPVRSREAIELSNSQNESVEPSPAQTPSNPRLQPNVSRSTPSSMTSTLPTASQLDTIEYPEDRECPVPAGLRDPMEPKPPRHRDAAWEKDGSGHQCSSFELLMQWLEIPGNPQRFKSGLGGMTAIEATRRCSLWLQQMGARTFRRQHACQLKLQALYRQWEDANDYMKGTGHGQGARKLQDAMDTGDPAILEQVELEVERECLKKCPEWYRLKEIFNEAAGGNASLRSDTTQEVQPILRRLQRPVRERNHRDRSPTASTSSTETASVSGTEGNSSRGRLSSTPRGNRALSRRGGTVEGGFPRSLADDTDVPLRHSKKKRSRRRSNSFELGILAKEDVFRAKKLKKMDESNDISRKVAAAQTAAAVTSAAATMKTANPTWSWDLCVDQAQGLMEQFEGTAGGPSRRRRGPSSSEEGSQGGEADENDEDDDLYA